MPGDERGGERGEGGASEEERRESWWNMVNGKGKQQRAYALRLY